MTKYYQVTEHELNLLMIAAEQKLTDAEGAFCGDYVDEATKTRTAIKKICKRNNLPVSKFIQGQT